MASLCGARSESCGGAATTCTHPGMQVGLLHCVHAVCNYLLGGFLGVFLLLFYGGNGNRSELALEVQ